MTVPVVVLYLDCMLVFVRSFSNLIFFFYFVSVEWILPWLLFGMYGFATWLKKNICLFVAGIGLLLPLSLFVIITVCFFVAILVHKPLHSSSYLLRFAPYPDWCPSCCFVVRNCFTTLVAAVRLHVWNWLNVCIALMWPPGQILHGQGTNSTAAVHVCWFLLVAAKWLPTPGTLPPHGPITIDPRLTALMCM